MIFYKKQHAVCIKSSLYSAIRSVLAILRGKAGTRWYFKNYRPYGAVLQFDATWVLKFLLI